MVLMRLGVEEQRSETIRKKRNLRERKEKILEDWTWEERKMRWKLEEIVRKAEREKKRIRIEYGRICIDDYWWKWDEKEEVLRDNKENIRLRRRGKGAEGQNWE